MTYLAVFYMGRIIKDTAALVEPCLVQTPQFSLPGFTPTLPFYCYTPQSCPCCFFVGTRVTWEKQIVCSAHYWVFQKEQLALEGPCLPLLVGLCESIIEDSIRLASSQVGVQEVSKS